MFHVERPTAIGTWLVGVDTLPPVATHRPAPTHSPTPSPCDAGHTMFHVEQSGGIDTGVRRCGRLMLWSGTARHRTMGVQQ